MPLLPDRGREAALARGRARVGDRVGQGPAGEARRLRARRHRSPAAPPRGRRPRSRRSTATYEREKRKRGLVDFDDLITGCADVLERDAEFAAAQRWRFRHLFVDEFQDASAAQFRLLRAWLGDRSDLCVVGDPDQAIYGFAGADASYLGGFRRGFPPERFPDVGVVQLWAATTGRRPRSSPPRARCSAHPGRRRRAVHAAAPDGPAPRRSPSTTPPTTKPAASRARAARRRERRSSRGRAWPCSTASTRSRPCSRRRSRVRASRSACAAAALPRPPGGEGRARRPPQDRRAAAPGASVRRAPHRPRHRRGVRSPRNAASTSTRWCDSGTSTSRPTAAAAPSTASSRSCRPSLRGDDAGEAADDAVELLTFHRAKGLEFDTVFVTGLETRARADLARQDPRGAGRGATAALRRAQPRRTRCCTSAGRASARSVAAPRGARRAAGSSASRTSITAGAGAAPAPGDARRSIADARDQVARASGGSTRTKAPPDVAAGRRTPLRRRWSTGDSASPAPPARPPT